MTSSVWVAPNTRLFLVAYEGADGKPYAIAASDHGVATSLARRFAGEVIDASVDTHADLANPVEDEDHDSLGASQ